VSERLRRARRGVRGGGAGAYRPAWGFGGNFFFRADIFSFRADIFPGRHISGTT
jgi:hypothetical protein